MTSTKNLQRSQQNDASAGPRIGDTKPAPLGVTKASKQNKKLKKQKAKSSQDGRGSKNHRNSKASGKSSSRSRPVEAVNLNAETADTPSKSDKKAAQQRGRYQMLVHKESKHTHTAVMQGRQLTEYSVSRDGYKDDEIFGNIYLGVVKNVYAGTEMAFIDIGTSKNAALHQGDMIVDMEDYEEESKNAVGIEAVLRPNQHIVCQVVKNPIAHKGARLTQEVSLPGRYVILIPNKKSLAFSRGISDSGRKRLRRILNPILPKEHGIIVRTVAPQIASDSEIKADLDILLEQWAAIEKTIKIASAPSLIYRGADNTFRTIRDKFGEDFRNIIIDDKDLYETIRGYIKASAPSLVERVEYYPAGQKSLGLFESHNVYPQLTKALDRRVWLPSGGELVIERTEAMTVVDVNTAKNTGTHNLEETALDTNLEAAVEIVRQLRLRDVGGIIVIDFIDLRDKKSRTVLMKEFRAALAQDATKTQVEDISTFGVVQLTRKRIGEDLSESFFKTCSECNGRGHVSNEDLEDRKIAIREN